MAEAAQVSIPFTVVATVHSLQLLVQSPLEFLGILPHY